jgi:lipopolysaccharide export LptBFGC system permease protein LptF
LYYTKNLDLAFYHSQKAYYFYIEFIEQISDDNVTFLQLSSKDATTFVYKKTIYEINNDYKKIATELTNDDKSILKYVDTYMYIYKTLIHTFFNSTENININTSNTSKTSKNKSIDMFCSNLLTIHNLDANKSKIKQCYLDCIYLFTNLLAYKQNMATDLNSSFTLIEDIFNHFISLSVSRKKQLNDKIIKKNIHLYFQEEIEFEQIFTNIIPIVKL